MHPTVGEKGVYRLYLWSPWTTKYASSFQQSQKLKWFGSAPCSTNWYGWTLLLLWTHSQNISKALNKECFLTGITTIYWGITVTDEILLTPLTVQSLNIVTESFVDRSQRMISLFPEHKSDHSLQRVDPIIIKLSSLCCDRFCVISWLLQLSKSLN